MPYYEIQQLHFFDLVCFDIAFNTYRKATFPKASTVNVCFSLTNTTTAIFDLVSFNIAFKLLQILFGYIRLEIEVK